MRPKLFVASSREALDVANGIHENLRHDAEVTVWNHGIFDLSQSSLESLLQTLDRMDCGLFVFAPDDIVQVRGEENMAARDNVIFELGLFVGRLGRERSFILLPSDQENFRLPTDLIGVTPGIYESSRSDSNFVSATALASNAVRNRMAQLELPAQGGEIAGIPRRRNKDSEEISEAAEGGSEDAAAESASAAQWTEAYFGGDYDRAISLLEKQIEVTDKEESKHSLRLFLGDAKAEVDLLTGVEYLTKAVEEKPEDSFGYHMLSGVYANNGLYAESLSMLDKGIQLAEEPDPLRARKASVLNDMGVTEEAKATLRLLTQENTRYWPAYTQLAQIFVDEGSDDKAREVYEKGLNVLPQNKEILERYAHFLTESGENEAALVAYRDLTRRHSDSTQYLTLLGNVYLSLGLHGLALEAYQTANEVADEKEGWILGNIGNLYKNQGFYPQAIAYLKRAAGMDPNSAYAHERLAQAIQMDATEREDAAKIIREHKQQSRTAKSGEQQEDPRTLAGTDQQSIEGS